MNHSLFEMAKAFLKAQHKKKIWYRVLYSMAVLVIFVTTYMLILPAITMERPAVCGMEEHVHTEDCYAQAGSEPVRTLNCGVISENPVIHTHDANCYDENGNLICQLSEVRDHIHTDACHTSGLRLTCGLDEEGTEGFGDGSADLFSDGADIFSDGEAHIHTEECYQEEAVLNCGEQEVIPHTHGTDCYDEAGKLVCTLPEINEHQHTEECFTETEISAEPALTCGKEEHVHTEACYAPEPDVTPTAEPGEEPDVAPTAEPSEEPDMTPTAEPSAEPGVTAPAEPSARPDVTPTAEPGAEPDVTAPAEPSAEPDVTAPAEPSAEPDVTPVGILTLAPEVTPMEDGEADTALTPTPEITLYEDKEDIELNVVSLDDGLPIQLNEENQPTALSDSTSSLDNMSNMLTSVLITDQTGNKIENVELGVNYKINLTFAEILTSDSRQFQNPSYYQLPAGIVIPDGGLRDTFEVLIDGLTYIGTWSADASGLVTVNFGDTSWQNYARDIQLNIEIQAGFSDRDNNGNIISKIEFSNDYEFTIQTEEVVLNVEKSHEDVVVDDKGNGKIQYKVEVTARNGDVSGLKLSDVFNRYSNDGSFNFDSSSITITDKNREQLDNTEYTVTDKGNGNFDIIFGNDYTLAENDTVTITYDMNVSGLDPDKYTINATNLVSMSGKDEQKNDIPGSGSTNVYIEIDKTPKKYLSKSGKVITVSDENGQQVDDKIEWTVSVTNEEGLAGASVRDVLGTGLTWENNSTITIRTDNQEYTISSEDITVTKNDDGTTTLEYVLPDGIEVTNAAIVYTTTYDKDNIPANGSKNYVNEVTITYEDGDSNSGSSTVSGKGQRVDTHTEKDVIASKDADGNTILNYEIFVHVPYVKDGYSPFYVTDSMRIARAGTDQGTSVSLTNECITSLKVEMDESDISNSVHYKVENGVLYIYFNGDEAANSYLKLDQTATIEISYSVDLTKLKEANSDLAEKLAEGQKLCNKAVNYYGDYSSYSEADYSEGYQLKKKGQVNEDGSVDYTVRLSGIEALSSELIGDNVYFVDNYAKGWKYVSGTLKATVYYNAGDPFGPFVGKPEDINFEGSQLKIELSKLLYENHYPLKSEIEKDMGKNASYIEFSYKLQPTDDWLHALDSYDPVSVHNSAHIEWENAQTIPAETDIDYSRKPIAKSVVQNGEQGNRLQFTIEVNELGETLLGDDSPLTLTDTMSSNLSIDLGSLNVNKIIQDESQAYVDYKYGYTTNEDGTHTLTLSNLPDSVHLVITYDTYVSESGTVTVSNTVSLVGVRNGTDEVEEEGDYLDGSISGSGSVGQITILKEDGGTNQAIDGATFRVYYVSNEATENLTADSTKSSSDKVKNGEQTYCFVYWYDLGLCDKTTGKNNQPGNLDTVLQEIGIGLYQIKSQFIGKGGYYVIEEVTAPNGYEKLSDYILIDYSKEYTHDDHYNIITVENTPLTTVSVQKEWKDSDGQTASAPENTSVEVALMQVAHYDYEEEVAPVETYTLTVIGAPTTSSYAIGIGTMVTLAVADSNLESIKLTGPTGTQKEVKTDELQYNTVLKDNCKMFTFAMDDDYTIELGNEFWRPQFTVSYNKTMVNKTGFREAVYTYSGVNSKLVSCKGYLNSGNGWRVDWDNLKLPVTGEISSEISEDGQEHDCTYTYYVKETTTGNWSVTYSVDGNTYTTCPDITDNTDVTVTNTIENQEKTNVSVEKKWVSETDDEDTDYLDSIEVQLYRTLEAGTEGAQYGAPITLGKEQEGKSGYGTNGWSYTWSDLPEGFYYYVVETLNAGEPYTVTYSNSSQGEGVSAGHESEAAVASGTITITNTKQRTMEVTVKKKWLAVDGTEKSGHPDTIQVGLYKKGQSEGKNDTLQSSIIELGSGHNSETGYSENGWGYTWSNLPLGTYYVKEVVVPEGYNAAYQLEATGVNVSGSEQDASTVTVDEESSDSTVILYNQETPVKISVQKEWSDGADEHADDVVTMQLYSSTIAPQLQPSVTPEPSITAEPTPTVTVEPTATPVPTATPEPSTVPTVSPEPTTTPEPTITPEPREMRAVTVFCPANGYNYGCNIAENKNVETTTDKVIVKITYNSSDMNDKNYQDICKKVSLEVPEGTTYEGPEYGTDSVDNYNYLLYTISGLSNVSGDCTLTFNENLTWPRMNGNTITPLEGGNSVALYSLDLADFELSAQSDVPTETGLILLEDAAPVGEAVSLGKAYALFTGYDATGWKYTWNNLPRTNAEGQKLYYYIKETSTGNYTTSYSYEYIDSEDPSKGIKLVTVTNTPTTPTTVDITVKKEWVGYDQNSYADYQVEVQLLQSGTLYGNPITLSASSDTNTPWSYTWQNLPSGYEYSVREIRVTDSKSNLSVTGYKASYGNNDGITAGEITITNTRETTYELPETGGPGTKLYTLGGLLLSVLAALLMYKQQKQRREVN